MVIKEIANQIIKCFKNNGKVLICGNGGSSAEADHFAGELVCKYKKERKALPAISLNNSAIITAIGNDYGFQYVFSRQVEALGAPQDILITLSTSGASPNILEAIKAAKKIGMAIISFPSNTETGEATNVTQEFHLIDIHLLCEEIEKEVIALDRTEHSPLQT